MRYILHESLKEYIFQFINEFDIFAFYLEINPTDIYKCLNNSHLKIHNKCRYDGNPSLSFRYVNDKIKSKDWGNSDYSGDCFHIVGTVIGENSNSKTGFVKICKHIINTLLDGNEDFDRSNTKDLNRASKKLRKKIPSRFKHITFNVVDKISPLIRKYWSSIGVNVNNLQDEHIFVAKQVWIDSRLFYRYNENDPCFVYYLGHYDDVPRFKVYRPLARSRRDKFRTNYTFSIERLFKLVDTYDLLIINKSVKDSTSMKYCMQILFHKIGMKFEYINYSSESSRVTIDENRLIQQSCKRVIQITDNDDEGIRCAKFHMENYGYLSYFTQKKDFTDTIVVSDEVKKAELNKLCIFVKDVVNEVR